MSLSNSNNKRIQGELNGLLSGFLVRKRIRAVLPFVKSSSRICDIGCGIYSWSDLVDSKTYYVGLDIGNEIIEYNQEHFGHAFYVKDIEQDGLADLGENYDLVIMLAVLEHFNNPELVLKKVKGILAHNGIIALTTPHPCGNLILEVGAKLRIFSDDKHIHNRLLNKRMIYDAAKVAGLKVIKYKRFLFGCNQFVLMSQRGV